MPEQNPPMEFEHLVRLTMHTPEPNPAFMTSLRAQFLLDTLAETLPQKVNPTQFKDTRSSLMRRIRTRRLAAILIALLILLILSGVVYALGRSLGYIPSLGVVDQSMPLRVLSKPVSVTSRAVTVTIEQGFSDVQQTKLIAKIESMVQPTSTNPCANDSNTLVLPNGQTVALRSDGGSIDEYSLVFPALPRDVTTATLHIVCLPPPTPGRWWAGTWMIPLQFRLSNEMDVVRVNTIAPMPSPQVSEVEQVAPNATFDDYGLAVALDETIELEDGYLLIGNLTWTDATLQNVGASNDITVSDANGISIPIAPAVPSFFAADPEKRRTGWAVKLMGKDHAWPVTISVEPYAGLPSVEVATFSLDLGVNPQPNHTWTVDQDIPVKDAGMIHITTVTLQQGVPPLEDPNSYGLSFGIIPSSPVVSLIDKTHSSIQWGGGGGSEGYSTAFLYKDNFIPNGPLTITVMYSYPISSTILQINWQP
jgi:hypothetical protein